MIDLKGIAAYDGNYSNNSEARRNVANHGAEFNKLIGGEFEDFSESGKTSETSAQNNGGNFIESEIEIITYNFTGKILKSEILYGLNYDAVV